MQQKLSSVFVKTAARFPLRHLCEHFRHVTCRAISTTESSPLLQAEPPKAALMIIGNEVLSGSIADSNTPWLAKLLYSQGVDLTRVVVVPDDPRDIGETCKELRERVGDAGFVFTSGGIGPTIDDVTYSSLAEALGLTLQLHQPTVELMKSHYAARGIELNESRLRMALLPNPAEVLTTPGLWVPLCCLAGNVYVLPGIPRLFQSMIEAHATRFKGPLSHSAQVFVNMGEGDVAASLAEVAASHPSVRIGSYPNTQFDMNNPDQKLEWRVKLVVEGRDAEAVEAAAQALRTALV